jgi:hypothetical protein
MRVNIYKEEMTDRIELTHKEVDGQLYTGVRFYLELPVCLGNQSQQIKGPFVHGPGDDDSSAVTFWGKQDLLTAMRKAVEMLSEFYAKGWHPESTRAGFERPTEDNPTRGFDKCSVVSGLTREGSRVVSSVGEDFFTPPASRVDFYRLLDDALDEIRADNPKIEQLILELAKDFSKHSRL